MPTNIRKVVFTQAGGPEVVTIKDASLDEPKPDHVQVRVLYAGFSGADIQMRRGTYPMQKKAPLTPGYCLVGAVHLRGTKSTRFQPGDLVACLSVYGAEATYANLPERHLVPVPKGIDLQVATALILDWNTAYGMVTRGAHVSLGQKVFVHGLSGAVGFALMKLCQFHGATVYGTASERNHKALRAHGAVPYAYTNKDWIKALQNLGGADAVFDALGFESWDESFSILSTKGVLLGYGGNLAALNDDDDDARSIVWPTLKLLGRNMVSCAKSTKFYYIDRSQKTFKPDLQALFRLVQDAKIKVLIKRVFALDEVPDAHRDWTRLTGMGSVVVKVE